MTTPLRPCTAPAPAPCPCPEWADWFRFRVEPSGADRAAEGAQ